MNGGTTYALIALVVVVAGAAFLFKTGESRIISTGHIRSQSIATSIATAIDQYYTEYNVLPSVPGKLTTDTAEGVRLLNILDGLLLADAPLGNPRGIRFLPIREGEGKRGGAVYDSGGKSITGVYDEWGNPFTVFLDTDSDEVLHLKLGSKETKVQGRRAAVVSPGADGKLGTPDDVKTW